MPLLLTMQIENAQGATPTMTKPTEWANLTAEDKEAFLKADLTNTIGLWKKKYILILTVLCFTPHLCLMEEEVARFKT